MVSIIQPSADGRSAVGFHHVPDSQLAAVVPSLEDWPDRRQQILTLAASLLADIDNVDIAEVDGEFYWKICRDVLFDPLSRLAASIAPHVLDRRLRADLSGEDRRSVESYRDYLQRRHLLEYSLAE